MPSRHTDLPGGSNAQSDRERTASRVWSRAKSFVETNDRTGDIRRQLGLGRGRGRIKAMLLLTDAPLSLAELAARHNVTAPYATIIVDQLEALGFVERAHDATDKRRKLVTLTETGRQAVAVAELIDATPPAALSDLTDDELHQLEALLARVTARTLTSD